MASLHTRRQQQTKKLIVHNSEHCLHNMLPTERDQSVTGRLRCDDRVTDYRKYFQTVADLRTRLFAAFLYRIFRLNDYVCLPIPASELSYTSKFTGPPTHSVGARLVMVAFVCRRRLSSVTLAYATSLTRGQHATAG